MAPTPKNPESWHNQQRPREMLESLPFSGRGVWDALEGERAQSTVSGVVKAVGGGCQSVSERSLSVTSCVGVGIRGKGQSGRVAG